MLVVRHNGQSLILPLRKPQEEVVVLVELGVTGEMVEGLAWVFLPQLPDQP
jgi:hypothetical protein